MGLNSQTDYYFFYDFTSIFIKFAHARIFWASVGNKVNFENTYRFINDVEKIGRGYKNNITSSLVNLFSKNSKINRKFIKYIKNRSLSLNTTTHNLQNLSTSSRKIIKNLINDEALDPINIQTLYKNINYFQNSSNSSLYSDLLSSKLSAVNLKKINEFMKNYGNVSNEKPNNTEFELKKYVYSVQKFKYYKNFINYPKVYALREEWLKTIYTVTYLPKKYTVFMGAYSSLFLREIITNTISVGEKAIKTLRDLL